MSDLNIKIRNEEIELKSEISEYFEIVNFYMMTKNDIEDSFDKVYTNDYKFFENLLKEKINKNIALVVTRVIRNLEEKEIYDTDIEKHINKLDENINFLLNKSYDELLDKIKENIKDLDYSKIENVKSSVDKNIEIILNLAEQYEYKKETNQYWNEILLPIFITKLKNVVEDFFNKVLNMYIEKVQIVFEKEKASKLLEGFENQKENDLIIKSAIEAYPMSIIEDSKVLFLLMQDKEIKAEIKEVIRFLHAENKCFEDIESLMKEEFYNMNIDEYRDIYKNFYLKCLKYREDLCKESTKDTIERCYEGIYKEVISKVVNLEDLILSENRISFLCNVLNTNREQIILSMLNKIEEKEVKKYKKEKQELQGIDAKKFSYIVLLYVALLIIIIFNNQEVWDKIIFIYIYLYFGFIFSVWYLGTLKEYKSKYKQMYEKFRDFLDKKQMFGENVLASKTDENVREKLGYKYLSLSDDVKQIIREFNNDSINKLLKDKEVSEEVNNKSKSVNVIPILIIVLFMIWIILLLCNVSLNKGY